MSETLVKISLQSGAKPSGKSVFIEVFESPGRKALWVKRLDQRADLTFELDNICKMRKIKKLSQLRIKINCGAFGDSITCRMLRLLKNSLRLLQG